MEKEKVDPLKNGKEIQVLLKGSFPITEEEGGMLLSYMEGHGYLLGQKNGVLHRLDQCHEPEQELWEPYDIDRVIRAVADWNSELLQEAEDELSDLETGNDPASQQVYLAGLREDELVLDELYNRILMRKMLIRILQEARSETSLAVCSAEKTLDLAGSIFCIDDSDGAKRG